MSYLVDTNILLRILQPAHPFYQRAVTAVDSLLARGEDVCFCPQNVREFWNVCTRPVANNGLGMTPAQVAIEVQGLEATLTFLPDNPAVYPEWRRLVELHAVIGVQVHDTNLVAVMNVEGMTHLITFNATNFRRFAGINIVEP